LGTHQGIVEVKREVKRQVNNVLAKGKVEDVYFRDFVFK
jgi:flagellar basal body-associated protein FliL